MAGNIAEGSCLGRGGRWEDDAMPAACCKPEGSTGSSADRAGRARVGSRGRDGLISGEKRVPTALPWWGIAEGAVLPRRLGGECGVHRFWVCWLHSWRAVAPCLKCGLAFITSPLFLLHTAPCFTSSAPSLCTVLGSRFAVGVCLDYTLCRHILWSWQPGSAAALPCPIPHPKQRSLVRHVSWADGQGGSLTVRELGHRHIPVTLEVQPHHCCSASLSALVWADRIASVRAFSCETLRSSRSSQAPGHQQPLRAMYCWLLRHRVTRVSGVCLGKGQY